MEQSTSTLPGRILRLAAPPLDSVATDDDRLTAAPDIPPAAPLRLRREVAIVVAFYGVYSVIRDLRGSQPVSASQALRNATRVIGWERTLGVFGEARIQHTVVGDRWLLRLLDDWYGSAHFVVTAAVLVTLFLVYPEHYRRWRNALAAATVLALVGFAWFPLMPPRLLPAVYGFTDTLRMVGGLWNFDSGPVDHLSDQYAAMPSLHFAWALWCGLALFSMARRRWLRFLALCYPTITLVCVIVTANHFFADTAAGAAIVAIGLIAASGWDRKRQRWTGGDKCGGRIAGDGELQIESAGEDTTAGHVATGRRPPPDSPATPPSLPRSTTWPAGDGCGIDVAAACPLAQRCMVNVIDLPPTFGSAK